MASETSECVFEMESVRQKKPSISQLDRLSEFICVVEWTNEQRRKKKNRKGKSANATTGKCHRAMAEL